MEDGNASVAGQSLTWREFWHWLTTTRYTRELEREIEQLRKDNDALLKALYPAIRAGRQEQVTVSTNTPKQGFY